MHKPNRGLRGLAALLLLSLSLTAQAQGLPDLAGTWSLTTDTLLPDENLRCTFNGQAIVTQVSIDLAGQASLTLLDGPTACPMEMTASLTGRLTSTGVEVGMLMGGQLGEAAFSGDFNPNDTSPTLMGGFDVTSGPFLGQFGNFEARLPLLPTDPSVNPIPTLAFYGVLLLILTILIIGGFNLSRHRLN